MQTESGRAAKDGPRSSYSVSRLRRKFRGRALDPLAIVIAVILAVISLGLMVAAFVGYSSGVFPPRSEAAAQIVLTPTNAQAVGLKVEPVGTPVRNGDTVTVTLKVTNDVLMNPPLKGTPSPNVSTPTAGPTDLYNATIKVLFTKTVGGKNVIVGSGIGNVTDLPHGQSKTIQIVAVPVGDFTEFQAFPDSVTNKAAVKPQSEAISTPEETSSPASPTP